MCSPGLGLPCEKGRGSLEDLTLPAQSAGLDLESSQLLALIRAPSIAAAPNGRSYDTAFQANTRDLVLFGDNVKRNTQQGLERGTSPSLAVSPFGGYRAAFQANNGNLYVFDSGNGAVNQGQGMRARTSPSITP